MKLLLAGLLAGCAVAIVAGAGLLRAQQGRLEQANERLAAVIEAQKASENTIAMLQEANAELMTTLGQWKKSYDQINRDNADARRQLQQLKESNKELCNMLSAAVPDAVWGVLFPKGQPAHCVNPN